MEKKSLHEAEMQESGSWKGEAGSFPVVFSWAVPEVRNSDTGRRNLEVVALARAFLFSPEQLQVRYPGTDSRHQRTGRNYHHHRKLELLVHFDSTYALFPPTSLLPDLPFLY